MENEIFMRLIITGSKKDINKISNFIKPNKVWKKGDLKTSKGTMQYKNNGCELFIVKNNLLHIEDGLNEFISHLRPLKKQLSTFNNIKKVFSIVVYSKNMMPSFYYSKKILKFIYSIEAELETDIYCL